MLLTSHTTPTYIFTHPTLCLCRQEAATAQLWQLQSPALAKHWWLWHWWLWHWLAGLPGWCRTEAGRGRPRDTAAQTRAHHLRKSCAWVMAAAPRVRAVPSWAIWQSQCPGWSWNIRIFTSQALWWAANTELRLSCIRYFSSLVSNGPNSALTLTFSLCKWINSSYMLMQLRIQFRNYRRLFWGFSFISWKTLNSPRLSK